MLIMLWKFSKRATALKSSAIREILKVTELPQVISFAGGLPSPETFPVPEISQAIEQIMSSEQARASLQYGPTEGYAPLRQWVADMVGKREKISVNPTQVLIVTGSQQALDLIGKALINKDSKVLVETPTYLGGLQSFSQYEPCYVSIDSDNEGIKPDSIQAQDAEQASFLYVIPNFQNPTGRRLTIERRQQLAAKAKQHDLVMIEDDPYGELDYQGHRLPSLIAYAQENTVYLGSFSKILSPGLRLGYIVASEIFINKLVQLKQAADLHTPTLTQYIAYNVIKGDFLTTHIPKIRQLYKTRCQYMLDCLAKFMPAHVSWTRPEGGMFLWLELPEYIDTTELLSLAVQNNVAFVPGETFFANMSKTNCLRLAFVTVPEAKIAEGIEILATLIKQQQPSLKEAPVIV